MSGVSFVKDCNGSTRTMLEKQDVLNGNEVVEQYPLSPLQQGMLFHYMSAPGAGTDIEQIVCTLREQVSIPDLRSAWERVIARHEVFRTGFRFEKDGDPVQVVQRSVAIPWEEYDWRSLASEEQTQRFEDLLRQDRHAKFDVYKAPLVRLTFIRMNEAENRLVWTFHHALLDGRSFPVVLNEVFAFYESFRAGTNLEPPLPRPYRDYIDWVRSRDFSHSEPYWRRQLQGFVAATPLVVDRQANSEIIGGNRQGDFRMFVSDETTSRLTKFAQDHGLTLNTLVQGAWALLLNRYSGEPSVTFGVVRACRKSSIEGADSMVGLFINTLPFRVHVPLDSSLLDWLKELRTQWIAMREHEHTPLAQVHKWSDIPAGRPLFDSILMFENYELSQRLQAQGRSWANRSFRLYEQTGYPITLTVYSGAELCLQIEFDRTKFDEPTVVRMVNHVKTLLEGMLAHPKKRLENLPYITEQERQQLTIDWNSTEQNYSREATLHRSFEAQVKRCPDSVAVISGEKQLTYSELNIHANRLAHHLQKRRLVPDDLVAICVERSAEMLIAMLGVLKAGGAYVPLDPAFPKERLGQIMQDAGVKVLLAERQLISVLPIVSTDVIYLDTPEIGEEPPDNPESGASATNLAYVIFTSGSTGRPKGVQIEHRAVMNFMESMAKEPGLLSEDTLVAVTTFSFDIAGLELFLPILTGARVVIASREVAIDGRRLARLLETSNATVMQATPATWRLLLETGWPGCKNMKILCGGEALPPELAEQLLPRCSSLWNMYGPTETTIWSTTWNVTSVENPIPIGRPIANTQTYILDQCLQPVPVGVPGELLIGGEGVARGYWQRPDLTADRFVEYPFSDDPTGRLYRTGDLCRWRADGSIECLGRNDHQVKIRGYRIELGDIEATLAQHPSVKQAVATVQEKESGENKLVVFVVANATNSRHSDELRQYLLERLPEYMVPSTYVQLEKLPLTPNGKVDRKSLPNVSGCETDLGSEWSAPANETEMKIAQVLEQVLGIARVGRNSNFFDMGADSLAMLRAASRLEQLFQRELAVIELFRNPTVKALAQHVLGNNGDELLTRSREQIKEQRELARLRLQRRQVRVN
jgi:amino acid adenylation domain-containing protein